MNTIKFVTQDSANGRISTMLQAMERLAHDTKFSEMRASVAYASRRGCKDLHSTFSKSSASWSAAEKRWLVSVDFGQTSPDALEFLGDLAKSRVRIPNGLEVLGRKLMPRIAFHPKTFLFFSEMKFETADIGLLAGSANMTFAGLNTNCEHAYSSRRWGKESLGDDKVVEAAKEYCEWWKLAWASATPLSAAFIKNYEILYIPKKQLQDSENLSAVVSDAEEVEIDVAEAVRWAMARCFWIETHHLYENRGAGRPGNQLDCRRGTRVFFEFASESVPQNTVLGQVELTYQGKQPQLRSVKFGNNSMDKVNLPIPTEFGPATYDDSVLHFERIGNRRFVLAAGSIKQTKEWMKKSAEQGTVYKLAGGRRFGFYS